MLAAALALLLATTAGARVWYARSVERRVRRRRPLGPAGIVVGAAPIDLPRASGPAALLLHGAGDTPQVLAGLAVHLNQCGFSVRVPLLSGHGRDLAAFSRVSSDEWLRDARAEYAAMRARHGPVALVGLSMGGALAIRVAAEEDDVPALVLLSPYVAMPGRLRAAATTSRWWGLVCPYVPSGGARSIHDPVAASQGLGPGVFTPAALRALRDTVDHAAAALAGVSAPTLMIQSRQDNRIRVEDGKSVFARLGAREKRLEWLDGAGHVISVDYGHERVFTLVSDWLLAHAREPS